MEKRIAVVIYCIITTLTNAQPVSFNWTKSIGGIYSDNSFAIATDPPGNTYTTGSFSGTVDFDPGSNILNLTAAGATLDIFISKLDEDGNFVWAKAISGPSLNDAGYAITTDASGNVYVTGAFFGIVDFDPGAGVTNLNSGDKNNPGIFILKLNASGDFVWAKRIAAGMNSFNYANSIDVDAAGNIFTTGSFVGTADFDPGDGTFNLTAAKGGDQDGDIFISKLNASGNFVWAKSMGSTFNDCGKSIKIDKFGNSYITGYFTETVDFDPSNGISNLTSSGSEDIFICKLNANGDFIWAKNMGGAFGDNGISIAVDETGNVYTTGAFSLIADFNPGANTYNLTAVGGTDIFVSKLNGNGDFVWAKSMGGASYDMGGCIALDGFNNVYTTGTFYEISDFDPGSGVANMTSFGGLDAFISKLDADGNFVWAKKLGGASDDVGFAIAVAPSSAVYTTGWFKETADFDPGDREYNLTSKGGVDIFINKLIQPTNGIKENKVISNFTVYPNPTNGIFKLINRNLASNVTIEVYNCLGAVVYKQIDAKPVQTIDLTQLINGLYFVKITGANKMMETQKIIKQ
jgi:hypothetical protein